MWHILLCGVVKWNVRFRHSIAVTTMGSAGAHYDCHPHVIKADGTGLKKLASRNGYRGVIDFLDVHDFHGGSSGLHVWAPDSKSVLYTAKVDRNVELFRVSLDRKPETTDRDARRLDALPPGRFARRQVARMHPPFPLELQLIQELFQIFRVIGIQQVLHFLLIVPIRFLSCRGLIAG
jgi:hypothetical protein